jgi:hypothetical protein
VTGRRSSRLLTPLTAPTPTGLERQKSTLVGRTLVGRTLGRRSAGWAVGIMAVLIAIVGVGVVAAGRSDATTSAQDATRAAARQLTIDQSAAASASTQASAAASAEAGSESAQATAETALAASIQSAVDAAQALGAANSEVSRDAVAVLDRSTGAVYTAGDADALYDTASLLKVAIVDQLFHTGQMADPDTAATALQMIEYSDDDDADALLGSVGDDDVLPTVAAGYGIVGVAGPTDPDYWGTTQITPTAMAQLMADSVADPEVGPWLLNAMSSASCTADDGWPQCYGVRALKADAPMKQGWMCCLDGLTRVHSTGLLGDAADPDRFVVTLFTEGDEGLYGSAGRDVVSAMAQQLAVLTD